MLAWGTIPGHAEDCFHSLSPTLMATPFSTRIECVSVTYNHVLALTRAGDVLSFGDGDRGQLGHSDRETQPVLKVIESLHGVRVVAIAAGSAHSMVLTDNGEVLSFGWGFDGRLGHGDRETQREPKVIEALRGVRVVAIAASTCYSMVLTDNGTVLSFGDGSSGKLGHGDRANQLEPKVIDALRGVRVVAIAAGGYHSMVLTDEGVVLSFGHGWYGRLGHGDEMTQWVPKVIEALSGVRVVAIAASSDHSMVLTDDGTVLSFGDGDRGQLGHGDEETQRAPKVIEALCGRRVVAIAAGLYQSMVLTDEGEVLSFGEVDAMTVPRAG